MKEKYYIYIYIYFFLYVLGFGNIIIDLIIEIKKANFY
jgi:hypothetical protein